MPNQLQGHCQIHVRNGGDRAVPVRGFGPWLKLCSWHSDSRSDDASGASRAIDTAVTVIVSAVVVARTSC
jgi:hypothetical protein